jgi:endoglucanase
MRLVRLSSLLVLGLALVPMPGQAQNYLHTNGSTIVDAQGNVVRLTGINWFGLETANYSPHGLWSHSMDFYLDLVKNQGYNCIRLPFCSQLFDAGSTPNSIDASQNPDLVGLSGIQIMDKVIAGCKARDIKVILDRHRPDSGGQSALWYTSAYSEARWISDWKMLAARYAGDDTVVGCDLHNEPHTPSTWGDGSANDWAAAATRCGDEILSVNPNLLILVEGIEKYDSLGYWWGGELSGAAAHPVTLSVPNQLVYSPHDYPASLYPQSWFSDPSYPANLPSVWDTHWGYLAKNNTAPILLGEFGTRLQDASDIQWFNALAEYIKANNLSFTFWCLNPNSGDTGGLLNDDWTTIIQSKQQVLASIQAPFITSGGVITVPAAPTGLAATSGNASVALTWTASNGATTYNLYRGTTAGGEGSTPVATGISGTSYTNTDLVNGTNYYFKVAAVNTAGTSALSNEASATPQNVVVVPATPTGLTATAGNGQVGLFWNASSGATSYNVYRGTTADGEATMPIATGITGTSFTDPGLSNGTTYFYKVAAVNSAGTSPLSNETSAKPVDQSTDTVTVATSLASGSGPWWGENDLKITNSAPISALSLTITVKITTGVSYNGQYNTAGAFAQTHSETSSTVTYTFTLNSGQTLNPGSWLFASQYGGTGTAHPISGDTYALTYTSDGQSKTLSGTF